MGATLLDPEYREIESKLKAWFPGRHLPLLVRRVEGDFVIERDDGIWQQRFFRPGPNRDAARNAALADRRRWTIDDERRVAEPGQPELMVSGGRDHFLEQFRHWWDVVVAGTAAVLPQELVLRVVAAPDGDLDRLTAQAASASGLGEKPVWEVGPTQAVLVLRTSFEGRDTGSSYVRVAHRYAAFARALADRDVLVSATIERLGTGLELPAPPHAQARQILVAVRIDDLEASYESVTEYLSAWDEITWGEGGLAIVSGSLTDADVVPFARSAARRMEALAKAARPGLTHWPDPPDDEFGAAEGSLLHYMPYDEELRRIEVTIVVPSDDRLPRTDLLQIAALLDGTPEGHPVNEVVVTFPNREMAEREAQALRDVGARVQYFANDGTWQFLD